MSLVYKHIIFSKSFWGIFLICGILLQPISKMAVMVHYAYNFEYYATVLCENISKPEMRCKGNCKLSKELNNIDQNTDKGTKQGDTKRNSIQAHLEYTIHQPFQFTTKFNQIKTELWNNKYLFHFISQFCTRIFHPPKDDFRLS